MSTLTRFRLWLMCVVGPDINYKPQWAEEDEIGLEAALLKCRDRNQDLLDLVTEKQSEIVRMHAVVDAARTVSDIESTGVLPDFMPLAKALEALDEASQ